MMKHIVLEIIVTVGVFAVIVANWSDEVGS